MTNQRFDYNDAVQVVTTAPRRCRPDMIGVVVGFTIAETEYLASTYGVDLGEVVCTVEIHDGSSFEVPAKFLQRVT